MLLKKGIVRKTFWFSVLLILIVVFVSFAVMYFVMPSYYLSQKEKDLENNLDAFTQQLRLVESEEECAELVAEFSQKNNVNVLSFDKDKMLLPAISSPFLAMKAAGTVTSTTTALASPDSDEMFFFQIRGEHTEESLDANISIRLVGGEQSTLSIASPVGTEFVEQIIINGTLQPIDEAKGVILSLLPYVLAIAMLIGLILSGIYAKRITRPILLISEAALSMQQMEPNAVSDVTSDDELGQLSDHLNALYTSLRENIEHLQAEMDKVNRLERSKTEMMQSASHELKTPVAALGGIVEGMIDHVGVYKDREKYLLECKSQVDRLSLLVGEILEASRVDIGDEVAARSEVFADELLEQALAENIYQINKKALRLTRELPPTPIITDADLFYRVLSNLISNAVRYTPVGGEIRLSIQKTEEGLLLSIENECEPIPQEEIPKLFEPFYTRSYHRDKTQSGTGLGLYIVGRSLERLSMSYETKSTSLGLRIRIWM